MDSYDLIHTADWLLSTANISPEWDARIRSLLYHFDYPRLERCVEWLKRNQLEPSNPAKQNMQRWKLARYGLI